MSMKFLPLSSPVGTLTALADDHNLYRLDFGEINHFGATIGSNAVIDAVENQLSEYFDGRRREFDIPLALHGSTFQQAVWAGLLQIPYGQTVGYAELAAIIGKPGAARAVGNANHANPICVIVPCHRVITSNGGLGGYGGGTEVKKRLLALEGVNLFS
ncbi:methylated-DNA--protein-cysteine methyltransferase [Clostridia bacterium]|nr:methylated-DNA--protein-cysteine methyltransferase [Clostridia bacterium]